MMKMILFRTTVVGLLVVLCTNCSKKQPQSSFEENITDKNDIAVLDGDSILLRRTEVRLLGIDTAEKTSPFFEGDQEPYATEASDYLHNAITNGKHITIHYCHEDDIWGRRLAYIIADGENLNAKIVESGLAYETVSFYGHSGFPEYAEQVMCASRKWKSLPFEKPYIFRSRNAKKVN
jgi:endonuclease YncB( thermonuclease family)